MSDVTAKIGVPRRSATRVIGVGEVSEDRDYGTTCRGKRACIKRELPDRLEARSPSSWEGRGTQQHAGEEGMIQRVVYETTERTQGERGERKWDKRDRRRNLESQGLPSSL